MREAKMISIAAQIAKSKSSIISHTQIAVKSGRMRSMNDIAIYECPTEIAGDFVVDAGKMAHAVKSCGDEFTVKHAKAGVTVSNGRFRSTIQTHDIDTYPWIENTDQMEEITLPSDFIDIMKTMKSFINPADVRAMLRGINISPDGVMAASNGHTMITRKIESRPASGLTIPHDAIDIISRIPGTIKNVQHSQRGMILKFSGDQELTIKLIDEKFPDVSRFIKSDPLPAIPADMLESVTTLAGFGQQTFKTIQVRNGSMSIVDGNSTASIDGFDLPDCAFNADYLRTMLRIAENADFSTFPQTHWSGNGFNGVLMGIKI
jgi:hypothetical protein